MKTNIKTEIRTQLDVFKFPQVLINLVIDYLNEPLPLINEERKSMAAFLLKIFGDLSIQSKIENRNPEECEIAFLEWIPKILTAIVVRNIVENSTYGFAQHLLKRNNYDYYIDSQEALYDLLYYNHRSCRHPRNSLNFIFVDILTKAKLIDTTRGLSFCIALHELARIYRFNITKNMATALHKEILATSMRYAPFMIGTVLVSFWGPGDTTDKPEDEKDQLLSCKKSYNQLDFDCRYLTHNGENGYLTLFPANSIRHVLALESKHLPITTSDPIPDLDSKKDNMIQALRNFIKRNSGFHFFDRDVIKTQINRCNLLITMLETLDLNRNIAVQTILSQVSVYKNNKVTNEFQTALEVVFKGMLSFSNQCISRLPAELYSSPSV